VPSICTAAQNAALAAISSAALSTSTMTGAVPASASAGTPRKSMVFTRY